MGAMVKMETAVEVGKLLAGSQVRGGRGQGDFGLGVRVRQRHFWPAVRCSRENFSGPARGTAPNQTRENALTGAGGLGP